MVPINPPAVDDQGGLTGWEWVGAVKAPRVWVWDVVKGSGEFVSNNVELRLAWEVSWMLVLVLMPLDPFKFDLDGKKAKGGVDFVNDVVVGVVVENGAALVVRRGSIVES